MNSQSRGEALLETIRRGLYASAIETRNTTLGVRSEYIGVSELAKYAECPRAAVAAKLTDQSSKLDRLLITQRGQWFEQGVKKTLASSGLNSLHQLEISVKRKSGQIKAHLDFTLVWTEPVMAVRILEVKSAEKLPDEPWNAHALQAQAQVDLLRHCWNKTVFSLRDEKGQVICHNLTFPQICKKQFGLEITRRPAAASVESWLLYVSMKDARAFGPYVFSSDSLESLFIQAGAFHFDLKAVSGNPLKLDELCYPQGFYPLCGWCEANAHCPKFQQRDYQPQWEPAINKLDNLKAREKEIHAEITEIEDALKQSFRLSGTKDWIDTGAHRFRMSMVAGRKSLDQDALKSELADILHGMDSDIDVDDLFSGCQKQGASFPRLTISAVSS